MTNRWIAAMSTPEDSELELDTDGFEFESVTDVVGHIEFMESLR